MRIKYLKSAEKDVRKINSKKVRASIKKILLLIKEVESLKEIPSLKKISGHPSAFRIRVGDYRIGLYYLEETIIIARIVKRNDIYKVFP
ncbi:type II toxin-antitoxin system RelE family toxin [Maribacter sp. 4G9]|uniref:type II toxin-antitoxin system RelE family toxin n=1 Tax=Maribacter sp. 4G9 TaxID=1889777 RepID=UPI000C145A29|nr:type II toxin-antitoxin system RelE/ParE family toxin [Maribacter sp. 4G9]PIB39303.1 plasmid stabilization protein [Maribacter sp. 4G9]